MIVLKFGGSSVGSSEAILKVKEILLTNQDKKLWYAQQCLELLIN